MHLAKDLDEDVVFVDGSAKNANNNEEEEEEEELYEKEILCGDDVIINVCALLLKII